MTWPWSSASLVQVQVAATSQLLFQRRCRYYWVYLELLDHGFLSIVSVSLDSNRLSHTSETTKQDPKNQVGRQWK